MHAYLAALADRVLVFDGATGTNLQDENLGPDDFGGPELEGCNEVLVDTRPDVIRRLHRSFLEVGADVVETDTFGSFPSVLAEYDMADRAYELSEKAALLAREVADEFSTPDKPRFVAGSMGPGTKMPSIGHISYQELFDGYKIQASGLLAGGVDLFIIETVFDLLQAKAAMNACRAAMVDAGREVPIQVQVTMETTGRMLVGTEIGAALVSLAAMRPDVIGINCATGPKEMTEHLRYLGAHSTIPISVLPNAGLPSVKDGHTHYDLTPEALAEYHYRFATEVGVNVVGGCCGTTPAHIAAVVERVRGLQPLDRDIDWEPSASSIYSPVTYAQDASVLLIGERTNTNGSKKFREALLSGDLDTCVQVGTQQVRESAHLIDVCVDYVGRDGTSDMAEIAGRFATAVTLPLCLDSTEPPVMEAGLQRIGGKCLLNSANLEDGEGPGSRFDQVMNLARTYGAGVVCLTIDEVGQARTRQRKFEIAKRIHDLATQQYGLRAEDLFFDCLALTLATGQEESYGDGVETIEGIRLVKKGLPGVHTTLGLSNISFGLKPALRHMLNSVFLHECYQAGLDSAILHAGKIMPVSRMDPRARELCENLVWNRRDKEDPLSALLNEFGDLQAGAGTDKEDRSDWPVEKRLSQRILDGDRNGLHEELDEAMASGIRPLQIVNDHLLEGMKIVGELFGKGEMQLPFVLQSAETMKAAVAYLEPHMEKADTGKKGKIVLATVKGDVHDIGKNLVDIILTNNGYEVHNLGIKVPLDEMVAKAVEVEADAIGMSGLLVKSTLIMRENVLALNEIEQQAKIPVLLGGAALTRTFVERDLRSLYEGRLFYGKDAFEGLRTMERLIELKRSGEEDPDFGRKLGGRDIPTRSERGDKRPPADLPKRSPEVAAADTGVPKPPFIGARVMRGIALDDIVKYLNETATFRHQWGFRPDKGETDEHMKERVRGILREQMAKVKAEGTLVPQVAYGYFPANAEGDDLIIWTDEGRTTERMRITFPRQHVEPFLCIADFFLPVESGQKDWVAFHLCTMGKRATEVAHKLKEADKYTDYLFLHGLSVEMTEALAEYWHRRIREEWGFADEDGPTLKGLFRQQYRGGRYSFGYSACPDLEDNAKIAELLNSADIGVECNEDTAWQYHPEQSTSAIICHHPRAKYFNAR